jgi:transposase
MAKPISDEKRADIIRHIEAGKRRADIAEWLFVCLHTVCRVWRKYKSTGRFEPEPPKSGRKPLVSRETMGKVMSKIRETPDITLVEMIEEFDLPISQAALSKRLINLGLTYKKRRSIQARGSAKTLSRQGKPGRQAKAGWR